VSAQTPNASDIAVEMQRLYEASLPPLEIRPTQKVVTAYYDNLAKFARLGIKHETALRSAFHELLEHCARQSDLKLVAGPAVFV
jgi:hypothetical protein